MLRSVKNIAIAISSAILIITSFGIAFGQTTVPDIKYVKGAACGSSGQGTCKQSCDPYENVDSSGPVAANGAGECGISNTGVYLTCCVPTHCGSNSSGVGTCVSKSSCPGTSVIGANTSDCLPPKLCCIIPVTQSTVTNDQSSVIQPADQTNPFTGQNPAQKIASSTPQGNTGGLVPCNGLDCSLCDLLVLIKNVINFLLGAIFAIAAAFVVWGSIEIMTSGGDEGRVSSGRERIWTSVLGIAAALGAWLFLGTILQVLTNSPSVLPWNSIQCSSPALKLKSYGNDNACLSLGGTCQDTSVSCDSNNWAKGKCLSNSSPTYQCCLPNGKIQITDCSTILNGTYTCTTSECPGYESLAGNCGSGHCCPKGAPTTPTTGLNTTECSGTCRSKCNNDENQLDEICSNTSQICCKQKQN